MSIRESLILLCFSQFEFDTRDIYIYSDNLTNFINKYLGFYCSALVDERTRVITISYDNEFNSVSTINVGIVNNITANFSLN